MRSEVRVDIGFTFTQSRKVAPAKSRFFFFFGEAETSFSGVPA